MEAQYDFDVATMLIDQTLLRTVEKWISESDIDNHRTYIGRTDNEAFIKWQSIEVDRGKRLSAGGSKYVWRGATPA